MSDCRLRAKGRDFEVDAYLKTSALREVSSLKVFRKGDPTESVLRPSVSRSGFEIGICERKEEDLFDVQVEKATAFLTTYRGEIERLVCCPGVDEVEICFDLFWLADTICYPITLPPALMLVAGQCGIAAVLNVLATSDVDILG